jgi:hypothetical protein
VTPAEAATWTAASRNAPGLPPQITDPVVLGQVATIAGLSQPGAASDPVGEQATS